MLNKMTAAVLIVKDLNKCMTFYQDILGLKTQFTDDDSAAYKMEDFDFVLLKEEAAIVMMNEEVVALNDGAGSRVFLCVNVADVDATYDALTAKGLVFIKAPKSQDWGRRTAYFADPEGNLWELWQPLPDEQ